MEIIEIIEVVKVVEVTAMMVRTLLILIVVSNLTKTNTVMAKDYHGFIKKLEHLLWVPIVSM